MSDQTGSPPAGWYNDPSAPNQQRWWDGGQWSSSIRPLDDTPPPPAMPPPAAHPGAAPPAANPGPDPFATPLPTEPAPPGQAPAPPGGRGSGRSGIWMLAVVAGALVLGSCVVLVAAGGDEDPNEIVETEIEAEPTEPDEADEDAFGSVASGGDTSGEDNSAGDDDGSATVDRRDQGTRAEPLPYDQPVDVTWNAFGDADGSRWTTTIGPPRDLTDEVLAANQFNDPPPDGVRFVGFEVEMTLVDAGVEPLAPGFNVTFEILGGATARVYDFATIETASFGCGVVSGGFDDFAEAFVGGTLNGTVCIPVPADDLGHPDTRVALAFLTGESRAIFGP